MNPDRLKEFLAPHNGSSSFSGGLRSTVKSASSAPSSLPALSSSAMTRSALSHMSQDHHHGGVLQVPPLQRGDLKVFQTTFRGGANLLAPPPPATRTAGALVVVPELAPTAPDVGTQGGRSLHQVWEKALFAHAEGLTAVDPSRIMKSVQDSSTGKEVVDILRYEPDRFVMGRVIRPKVKVETVPAEQLHSDGAVLMSPKLRRAIHDAEVNSRQGHLALREAYKARRKLALNCAINFPHGVLGCNDTPYAVSGLQSDVYGDKAKALLEEEMKAQRKGRGAGAAFVKQPPSTGLDLGGADRPPRVTGRNHACVPADTLNLGRL